MRTRVEVVPHGISSVFMEDEVFPSDPRLRRLLVRKTLNGYVYVLYFLWHSGFRKGADLVYKVMREIQRDYPNVVLVVKRGDIEDPYMSDLRRLKCFEVVGWLSERELVALYDLCDVCIVPSRGGGFELNAVEALARGLPTLVPRWGCFLDYVEYCVPVDVESYVRLFGDNPVHVGRGASVSVLDFYFKLKTVIDDLEEYKERFRRRSKVIREKYSWENVCKKLRDVICDVVQGVCVGVQGSE